MELGSVSWAGGKQNRISSWSDRCKTIIQSPFVILAETKGGVRRWDNEWKKPGGPASRTQKRGKDLVKGGSGAGKGGGDRRDCDSHTAGKRQKDGGAPLGGLRTENQKGGNLRVSSTRGRNKEKKLRQITRGG